MLSRWKPHKPENHPLLSRITLKEESYLRSGDVTTYVALAVWPDGKPEQISGRSRRSEEDKENANIGFVEAKWNALEKFSDILEERRTRRKRNREMDTKVTIRTSTLLRHQRRIAELERDLSFYKMLYMLPENQDDAGFKAVEHMMQSPKEPGCCDKGRCPENV